MTHPPQAQQTSGEELIAHSIRERRVIFGVLAALFLIVAVLQWQTWRNTTDLRQTQEVRCEERNTEGLALVDELVRRGANRGLLLQESGLPLDCSVYERAG